MALGTILAGVNAAAGLATAGKSLFSDDDKRGSRLRELYENRLQRLQEQSPAESSTFQAGASALQEEAEQQAERDRSAAVARGLGGSQLSVAQDQNRAEATASGLRDLIGTAERTLQQRRQQARAGLTDVLLSNRDAERRRESRLGQIAGSAFQSIPMLLGGPGGGSGGGDGSSGGGSGG